jgi:DNA-binding beta-propeller fold protein YncE
VIAGQARDSVPVVVYRAFSGTLQPAASVLGRPFGVTVSPQQQLYVTEQDGNALARFALPALAPGGNVPVGIDPGEVIFTSSGATAYTANVAGRSISVINVVTGAVSSTFNLSSSPLRIRLSADNSRLFVSMDVGKVLELDPTTGALRATIPTMAGPLNGMVLSPNGQRLYVTSTSGAIAEIDTQDDLVLRTIPVIGTLQDIGISPDGSELYVAVEEGALDFVNVASGATAASAVPSAFGLQVSPNGYFVALSEPTTGKVVIFDRVLRRLVAQFAVAGTVRRVAFDSDGQTLAVASESNAVYVIR